MEHSAIPRNQAGKIWEPRPVAPLAERTIGIVGLGPVGLAIARRAKSAGMSVAGLKRDVSADVAEVDQLFAPQQLEDLLRLSDFVVLAVPKTPETTGLIAARQFREMRRSAVLINVARGSVVVEADLVRALEGGNIAGAVLDVFEQEPLPAANPLWTMPNVVITPHVAGSVPDYIDRAFEIFADNLERYLAGQPLRNQVDLLRGY